MHWNNRNRSRTSTRTRTRTKSKRFDEEEEEKEEEEDWTVHGELSTPEDKVRGKRITNIGDTEGSGFNPKWGLLEVWFCC